jgi:hypothetical protein
VKDSATAAKIDEEKFHSAADAASANIERRKEQLALAKRRVQRAEDELESLRRLPPLPEPTYYEEVLMANKVVPKTEAAPIRRCR